MKEIQDELQGKMDRKDDSMMEEKDVRAQEAFEGNGGGMGRKADETEMALKTEEDSLDAELEALMKTETPGKNKRMKQVFNWSKWKNWKNWSRKKKLLTGAAVILGGLLLFRSLFISDDSVQMQVMTVPVAKGDIKEELIVSGPVSGTDSVDVVSNIHAEVTDLRVKEGDRVEAGQLLAVIDGSDIEREVEIAQNAYDLAVATYNEQQILAENGYAKALQDYEAARAEYERTSVLYEAGDVSMVAWETARNQMNDAQRAIRNFTIKDGKAVANESYALQIKNAEFELQKKKEELEDCQVASPITGTVVRVNTKVGRFADTIEDDKPMFIIENLDVLEMKINISEYSIGKVQVGQDVEITADILGGNAVKGCVTAISPTGEEKGGGSTERVIPTTIKIEEKDTKLIAGITARAKIILSQAENALIVPISAVLEEADGTYVVAVQDNIVKRIPVSTGVESDIQVQVIPDKEGELTEGMAVVANPVSEMAEGMKVIAVPSAQ